MPISWELISEDMSEMEAQDENAEDEAQKGIDRAVEEALDLDFASFEDTKEAFRS